MHSQDKAIFALLGVGFIAAVIAFIVRRNSGRSRAMATAFATGVFGATLAAGILFGIVPFSRSSFGLERIVIPAILMIVTAALSAIFGLVVHLFDHRKTETIESLSLEAQIVMQEIEHDLIEKSSAPEVAPTDAPASRAGQSYPAWKRFAIAASKR